MTPPLRPASVADERAEQERRERQRGEARAEALKATGAALAVIAICEAVVLQTLGIAALIKVLRR